MKDLKNIYKDIIHISESSTKHKLLKSPKLNMVLAAFIEFSIELLKISQYKGIKVNIRKFTKKQKGVGGYVDMVKINPKDKSKMLVNVDTDMGMSVLMKFIAHELTHAKQIVENRLWHDDSFILWEGKPFISSKQLEILTKEVAEGNKPESRKRYYELPWEVEAKKSEKTFKKLFTESKQYSILKDMGDVMIDMIIDSL